ncbi:putative agamous-like MADS-box protein AGL62-like [Capsicum annuum]|uniref:agamous-like MADS-box protein AGL62 n=1 Tax=Capsicum annuum TaxID=4072 RepID=UPI001FB0D785|nr:agamous-like MADS-box protein AGL62 [Capsicum annuum]KAF3615836.1 putative agamous-like MADS-box protein AGL62-like [Capsicum annuum]KAF3616403.1 putative agamous-like MADS-box protein AGL62-like [Capsicum annuum]
MARRRKGRQRVDIVKMKNESNLQVMFSKRRAGVFKKASELCTLCGAEIAIVVFSPGKKVYSFGHPSVELLVDRFLGRSLPPPNYDGRHNHLLINHRNVVLRELNKEVMNMEEILQMEKARGESILEIRRRVNGGWWEAPINALNLSQLQQLMEAMGFLKQEQQMLTNVGLPFLTFGSALSPNTNGAMASSSHGLNIGTPFANRA